MTYYERHRERILAAAARRYATDPEFRARNLARTRLRARTHVRLKRGKQVRIPRSEQAELLRSQAGLCGVCSIPLVGAEKPQTDHCHKTGKVRGMLCRRCNIGIGYFQDCAARLRAAAEYLQKAKGPPT